MAHRAATPRARRRPLARAAALLLLPGLPGLLALVGACGSADPMQRIRDERARWSVQPLEWVQLEDGAIHISTRVSGPPSSKLAWLTACVELFDENGASLGRHWYPFDLEQVPRGGPADLPVRLPAVDHTVGSVTLRLVLDPTPEEATHIRELQSGS